MENQNNKTSGLDYPKNLILKITDILKQLLTGALDLLKQIFTSIEFLNFKILLKWIGFTCFLATLIANSPDYLVDSSLKNACLDYLQTYKAVYMITQKFVLELFTNTNKLELQIQLMEQQHLKSFTELTNFTNNILEGVARENSENIKNIISFSENAIRSIQSINDTKISFLEKEIERLTNLQIEGIRETNKLIMSNQDLMTSLAKAKEASTLSYIAVTLGIIHGGLGSLAAIANIWQFFRFSDTSGFECQALDLLKYIKSGVDFAFPATPKDSNPVFPKSDNVSSMTELISRRPTD